MISKPFWCLIALLGASGSLWACDLCAVYVAGDTRGEAKPGWSLTVSELYARAHTVQFEGQEVNIRSILDTAFLDNSMTHMAVSYDLSPKLTLSVNVPLIHRRFKRLEQTLAGIQTESGSVTGLGDLALIGQWKVLSRSTENTSLQGQLLGGVKLPTGDTGRIRAEVGKAKVFQSVLGGGVHRHEFGGVHEHELSLGSGSFDAIFGAALNARWHRFFLSTLAQYYWRTKGEASFRFGDEILISGGPGAELWAGDKLTLSLQANAAYESRARAEFLGLPSNNTGMTAWFLGPQLLLAYRTHLTANAGIDVPLRVENNGLQNVPDYRVHAGFTWRF